MTIPTTKQPLLSAIHNSYAKLEKELRTIPANVATHLELEGHSKGTQMSITNLVAYLIGWNALVLKWHHLKSTGLPVDFPETDYKWNALGRLAQKFYQDYADIPYPELLERFAAVKTELVALIECHSDDDLYDKPWYNTWTMGRMIQFNSSSPYQNAYARIRKWKKAQKIK